MNSYWSWWELNWLALSGVSISASGEAPNLPVGNLVDQHTGTVFRMPSTTGWFAADLLQQRSIRHIAVFGMPNITSAAEARIRLSNVALGNGDVFDTRVSVFSHLLKADGGFLLLADGSKIRLAASENDDIDMAVSRGFDQWVYILEAALSARYVKVDIIDPTNANSWLDFGAASIGLGYETALNPVPGMAPGHDDTSIGEATDGGQTQIDLRPIVRRLSGGYDYLPEADAMGWMTDLARSGPRNNCLFVPQPNGAYANRQAVYGLLDKANSFPFVLADRFAWNFTIRERL